MAKYRVGLCVIVEAESEEEAIDVALTDEISCDYDGIVSMLNATKIED